MTAIVFSLCVAAAMAVFFHQLWQRFNLLRVPPEVELEGLDLAEFQMDFYPEFQRPPEVLILPDGTEVDSAPILLESYYEVTSANGRRAPERVET